MESSPRRSRLYRSAATAVILLAMVAAARAGWGQFTGRSRVEKGPRALGLIQLGNNGKGRLMPVAIMVDGKFYDASAYKAMPVPMALDFDIVYEGFRTGVSQGLFTIKQPGQLNHAWIAEGTWLPAGAKVPEGRKKAEVPNIEEKDERPRLHRAPNSGDTTPDKPADKASPDKAADKTSDKDKSAEQKPASSTTSGTAPAGAGTTTSTTGPSGSAGTSAGTTAPGGSADAAKTAEPAPAATVAEDRSPDDPNRPFLRRGKPDPTQRREAMKVFDVPEVKDSKSPSGLVSAQSAPSTPNFSQWIPAISDVAGPDPRPYTYDLQPAEEASFRAKILDLASAELQRGNNEPPPPSTPGHTARKSTAAAKPKVQFDEVHLRVFDLSNANEPVLVLSAKTHLPKNAPASALPQEVTLVAKTNLEGELRKLFFSATDARDLDISPRMELIDAVDADGDGRGELLFRRTFDSGSAYAIYRVTADQLWPLFEGTP